MDGQRAAYMDVLVAIPGRPPPPSTPGTNHEGYHTENPL